MINTIKNWQLRKAISSHKNYNKRNASIEKNEGKRILLISTEEYKSTVDRLASTLRNQARNVDVLYFSESGVESTEGNIYSKKNLKWSGIPSHEHIDLILSRKYDIMYYLKYDIASHDRYMLELVRSRFNIGPNIENSERYMDLIIDQSTPDLDDLIFLIKKQLGILSRRYEQ